MIDAGVLSLRIAPVTTNFWRETDAKLRAQKSSKAEVPVEANIRKASQEIAMFRMREQANAINLKVKVDEKSVRTANEKIRYIEHTWKQSDIKRAIRVQVFVAGATALPALTQGIVSLTTAMTELGRSALALPGLLAGVGTAAATLLTGFSGITQALKAAGDGMKNSEQYARQYAQATRQLEDAQRNVVTALRNANREIEDQKQKLAEGSLSVEQARLNVRRANEALARGGFRTFTDYQQALLDVRRANLDLSNTIRDNKRNIEDYYATAQKGATGSDAFKDSLDSLSKAVDDYRKAQFQAAGMSEQFISAMKGLSPAGQDFVLQLLKIKDALRGLKDSVETTLVAGLGDSITNLVKNQLPMLKTGMQQVAVGLNAQFKSLFAVLNRQSNSNSIAKIFESTGRALKAATPGVDSFISGVLKLSEVGARFLPRLSLAFNKVLGRFEAFINKAAQDGSLERWIDSGLKVISSLGRSLLSIGSILGSITTAYNKATGNVGGFASTLERSLGSIAKRLASPEGQTALISWMRTTREFLGTIREALPGIRKIFAAIGDGARKFAETFFPIFAGIGNIIGDNSNLVTNLVRIALIWRTLTPIISLSTKALNRFNAGVQKFNENAAKRLSARNAAWKEAFDAEGMRFAAKERLDTLRLELNSSQRQLDVARANRAAALNELRDAQRFKADARKEARAAKTAADSDLVVPGVSKDKQQTLYLDRAKAYESAKQREAEALAKFNKADDTFTKATVARADLQFQAQNKLPRAYRDLRKATDLATEAGKNFNRVSRLSADGMVGAWSRGVDRIKGKMYELRSALKFVVGSLVSVGATIGLIAGFDQLTAAQDRNRSSADKLRESQDALAQSLSKGTGSATAATLEENSRQLRDRVNPYSPDDPGQNFNAAKTLERQLGIPLSEAVTLTLPTEVARREARLAPADAKVIAAVPELQEWKQWGQRYKENGVDETVYGKALNGDPDSIGKVKAAREAIKNSGGGKYMNMGLATATGFAPNDLGAAQEQLPRTGATMQLSNGQEVPGGLRALSLAAGAARGVGNDALKVGQQEQENANLIPQFGLNQKGRRVFGPFVLGAAGAIMKPDGSAVIEVDRYPDEVVSGWTEGASDKGISVERRFPNGAIITIDPEHAKEYFKASANEYARGGSVWGAGTATSDSIPAMLSNGEFVINARSASLIGHDKLNQLNSIGKFSAGGPVLKLAPGGPAGDSGDGGGGNIFTNIWDWLNTHVFYSQPDGDAAAAAQGVPKALPSVSVPVDSGPVVKPLPSGPSGTDIAASLGGPNGALYIPRLGGSGALPDIPGAYGGAGTAASISKDAPINPNANILDYLVQVANSWGLAAGSGPVNKNIADELGIWTHSDDGGQHSVQRALDIGNPEQAKAGLMTTFVKDWMSDPNKVAATRQLIFQDPTTGEAFAIYGGKAYFGQDAWNIYGGDFPDHRGHIHLALEGVPASMFSADGLGVPLNTPRSSGPSPTSPTTGSADPQAFGDLSAIGAAPPPPASGPAAAAPPVPSGPAPAAPAPAAPGPAGEIPFDPFLFLKQIGAAILKGIFGFFGIDASSFVDSLFGLIPDQNSMNGESASDAAAEIPQPDPLLLDQMDQQIEAAKAQKTKSGDDLAKRLEEGKNDYLKQFSDANVKASAEDLAKYYDSIGDTETAAKLRGNAGKIGNTPPPPIDPAKTPPPGQPPTLSDSGGLVAPPANYSPNSSKASHNAVYRAFKEAGFPDSEWPPLVELLNHENDTWDPKRPTGGPNSDASGIFQFLSTTWDTVGMEYSEDPYIQGVAGMRYIKQRYGTPTAAWNFWQNPNPPGPPGWPHWYSLGGIVRLAKGGLLRRRNGGVIDPSDPDPLETLYGPSILAAFGSGRGGSDLSHLQLVFPDENAAGGYITGPGTGTSDSIPAMLSDGEYVIRASSVKSIGVDRLDAMNKNPKGFASGGLVKFAPGGLVGGAINPNQPQVPDNPDWKDGLAQALADAGIYGSNDPSQGTASATSVVPQYDPGPLPNVVKSPFKQGVTDFSAGVMGAADANITGTIDAIKNPGQALIGLGSLVPMPEDLRRDIFGKDVAQLGDLYKGMSKELTKWDEWATNPLGALGGITGEFGAIVAGGAARGAKVASEAATINRALKDVDLTDLKMLPRSVRKDVKQSLFDLRSFAPGANLEAIRVAPQAELGDGTYAMTAYARPVISLTKELFGDPKALRDFYSADIAKGYHNPLAKKTDSVVRAIIAHEYAHLLRLHGDAAGLSYDEFGQQFVDQAARYLQALNPELGARGVYRTEDGYAKTRLTEPGRPYGAWGEWSYALTKFMRNALSGYSYEPVFDRLTDAATGERYWSRVDNREVTKRMLTELAPEFDDIPELGPMRALGSIDMEEALAEGFGDVFMRGDQAKPGSIMMYRILSDQIEKATKDWGGGPLPKVDYPLFPGLRSTRFGYGSAPKPGRSGSARTWEGFAGWAGRYWPFEVQEAIDSFTEDMVSFLGTSVDTTGSPFDSLQFEALRNYSGSSSVNKTLRGIDQLPERTRRLRELLDVRSSVDLLGGNAFRPLRRIDPTSPASRYVGTSSVNRIFKDLADEMLLKQPGMSIKQIIDNIANHDMFAGLDLTPMQVWENLFVHELNNARISASRAKWNTGLINILDSAFEKVPPLPQDMWVTRMVSDFGDGPVTDPESLVGKLMDPNPGYSSTAGGITYLPQMGRDWWKGVFGDRNIMTQLLVPKGTPAIWYGGGENELLLPRGGQFLPLGHQYFRDLTDPLGRGRSTEDADLVKRLMGIDVVNKSKFFGDIKFPDTPPEVPDIGFSDLDSVLRPLGQPKGKGRPGWMNVLGTPAIGATPWHETDIIRDGVLPYSKLGYASGGFISGPGGPKDDRIPAMLSNGEFVMSAEATKYWGIDRLSSMNAIRKYAPGGPVLPLLPGLPIPAPASPTKPPAPPPQPPPPAPPSPTGSADPQAFTDLSKPAPPPTGSSDPDAFADLEATIASDGAGLGILKGLGNVGPKGGGSAGSRLPTPKDPRSRLAPAPTSSNHVNPALAAGIKGAFNTVGALAGTAASLAMASGTMGASAAMPGAGQAASTIIQGATQLAGDLAVGGANILSSLLVGTVTPSETGQGYGAPLLPQQQTQGTVSNFQSIHNGNIVTNNLSEYSRLKDRKDAQKSAPFFNRVNQ